MSISSGKCVMLRVALKYEGRVPTESDLLGNNLYHEGGLYKIIEVDHMMQGPEPDVICVGLLVCPIEDTFRDIPETVN